MLNGIAITVVGMLTVFIFLTILVLAMQLLKWFAGRFLSTQGTGEEAAMVAAAVAAAMDARERARQ